VPYLGDYLGHLLSEITIARMKGDLESVRVAELYSSHPLLRNMPVPHFRLPDVELDVPVAIKQMEEEAAGGLPRGTPALTDMRRTFDRVLASTASEEGIHLTPKVNAKLRLMLNRKMTVLSQPNEIAVDVNRVADEMSNTAYQVMIEAAGPMEKAKQQMLEEKLKEASRLEFLKLRKPPARLQALVTTAEIREAGPSEAVTRIHLKITEESFEWTTIESEGKKQDKLVIE
jgi:hypothetical protein